LPSHYSPAEVDEALIVLAYHGGNAIRTSTQTGIPAMTLRDWRNHVHRDRYLEIAERERPKLEAIAVDQALNSIIRSGEIEGKVLDLLDAATSEEHEALKPKDIVELTGALQRVTTSKGINTDKLMTWTGRPKEIIEHRDPKQAAAALARRLGVSIDSTATEEPARTLPLPSQSVGANVRELPAVD
jgi:hypothetical protein